MKHSSPRFSRALFPCLFCALLLCIFLCVSIGSVGVPLGNTFSILWCALWNLPQNDGMMANIILHLRLPRVLNVALVGALLSLCGAVMQGLLRNPLADGATLGVSSGASLGAVMALLFPISFSVGPFSTVTVMAILFAFLSLLLILSLSYSLDRSLATGNIILIGVIFSMFVSSIISLLISFSGEKLRTLTFWTMGSFSGTNFSHTMLLLLTTVFCGTGMLLFHRELNAFSLGENNARHLGVPVKRVKLMLLALVSVALGVCVSVSGTIGFVGLVVPHMVRMMVGPDHRRLLPTSMLFGAIFLLLGDLLARTLLSPIELNIGVITSMVGALAFIFIFYQTRKGW